MLIPMETNADADLPGFAAPLQPQRRALYQAIFFLLVWPSFNLLIISTLLSQAGYFESAVLGKVALRMFSGFAAVYGIILLLQHLFPTALSEERFWPQWALHLVAMIAVGQVFRPVMSLPTLSEVPEPTSLPLILFFFQMTLYVAAKTWLLQRSRYVATQLNLRQAHINMLRARTNPHFLFNTLNLLASEISRNPDNARDIVYDLADLLRDSMRAAEKEFTTLQEELRLVRLYLTLQQKRFPDRLRFDLDVEERCARLHIPALLIQPLVENVVKHVVSQSTEVTELRLTAKLMQDQLHIKVCDNGPATGTAQWRPAGGLRIVADTLALQYNGQASLEMESTPEGGRVSLRLPLLSEDAELHR